MSPTFFLIVLTVIAVPLAFNPWGYNSFAVPKAALIRALAAIVLLAALIEGFPWVRGGTKRPRRDPLVAVLVAAALTGAAVLVLSSVMSVNPRMSLWGNYGRQEGLLTRLSYVVLFLVALWRIDSVGRIERLMSALVWSSVPVVLYGFAQAAGIDPFVWRSDAASPVMSTFGRANFLGAHLVMVMPLTLAWVLARNRPKTGAFLLAAQFACLALTLARGAWIGFAVAVAVFGLVSGARRRRLRIAIVACLPLLIAGGTLLELGRSDSALLRLAQRTGSARLVSFADLSAGSAAARTTIWRTSWKLARERPWLGYGPDTMPLVFERVYPPQLVYYLGRHTTVDRAHNVWLDQAMASGLAGATVFGILLAVFCAIIVRGCRAASDARRTALWAGIAAAVAGHLADLHFSFDEIGTATVFWMLLAMACGLYRAQTADQARDPHSNDTQASGRGLSRRASLTFAVPALLLAVLIAAVCLKPVRADVMHCRALAREALPLDRLAAARRAVRAWPVEPSYRITYGSQLGQAGEFDAADEQFRAADRLAPDDPRIWAARGDAYAHWAGRDPAWRRAAEHASRRALNLAPTRATYHTALGLVLAQQGRLDEGVAELERAVDLDATDAIAYGHLAGVYQAMGRPADAERARAEAQYWRERTHPE
ncbi:O-antigen ligase family protein [Candidatus Sumerlaeota bacterium]|nr:O-antigen ligase family protein [Candidatus Sumerlaeota bacterium]